jgi:hypothetical protein
MAHGITKKKDFKIKGSQAENSSEAVSAKPIELPSVRRNQAATPRVSQLRLLQGTFCHRNGRDVAILIAMCPAMGARDTISKLQGWFGYRRALPS